MRHPTSVVASIKNGQRGWRLRWRDGFVRLSYWFADEGEALAVCQAMRRGASFEAALEQIIEAA